jgi:8-oxo-dGTP pyrophosphatase MutT (NUDIX family)
MTLLQKWQILDSTYVINNQWCKVRQDRVKLGNGIIVTDYFVTERPEIALVLPITPQKELILVRQYRHGIQEILLELPAGSFDPNQEDAINAARRELEEETVYLAPNLIFLTTLYDNPVKDNNRIHLLLALNVVLEGQQNLDPTEEIEVVLVPIAEIPAKIASREICVAGTLAAIFLGLDYLAQNQG